MQRIVVGILYGVIGLAVAVGLTFGAYALAGKDLSKPAEPVGAGGDLVPSEQASPSGVPGQDRQDLRRQRQRERIRERRADIRAQQRKEQRAQDRQDALDDHGGSGSDDSGASGSGSGDSSGSGSDDSGSDDHGSDDD